MQHKFKIAVGHSSRSTTWKNQDITWGAFVDRLRRPYHTNETHKEFLSATKEEQHRIKDVGGYVGGYLRGGRRKLQNVVSRQLITLDIDFASIDFWGDFILQYDCAAVVHSTHKHCDISPRLRLIIPLDREVSPEEYVAISRKVAGNLDIELFDNTTFDPCRLMFWQSTPKDQEYYFREQQGAPLVADDVLAEYADWTDSSLWPTSKREADKVRNGASKQQDPTTKAGIVGAFCRAYTIEEAIEKFLKDEYEATDNGRYTYKNGSTASGLVVYGALYSYSHHGTDPTGGKLCNAFDLVRIHRFAHLDSTENATERSESYKVMCEFAQAQKEVKRQITEERLASAKVDFEEPLVDFDQGGSEADDDSWMEELELEPKSTRPKSSAQNLKIIFENDPRLKGAFEFNSFDSKKYVCKTLPWRKVVGKEPIKNVDFAGVRAYLETFYEIVNKGKIEDAMDLVFDKNSHHPVQEYLKSVTWDGVPRVETLLIDYFGAEDNVYTREAMKVTLVGAVSRVMRPGCKFDTVLVLVGGQGIGKSTFIRNLGRDWYSDTLMSVSGKEAFEQIQGVWLMEMAELSSLKKADMEASKHFISKQDDIFRPAYARTTETFKRQCIFIGSTNEWEFLRDSTGNRRFLPIAINANNATKSVFTDMSDAEVAQIWAEAFQMFRKGAKTYLSGEAEGLAMSTQRKHLAEDDRRGILLDFLDMDLPANWDDLDIYARMEFINNPREGVKKRDCVCVAEIWCELFAKKREDMSRYNTKEINDMLKGLQGWEQTGRTKYFKNYGHQKIYVRR